MWSYASSDGSSRASITRNLRVSSIAKQNTAPLTLANGFSHPGILLGSAQLSFVSPRSLPGLNRGHLRLQRPNRPRLTPERTGACLTVRCLGHHIPGRTWAVDLQRNPDEGCSDELTDSIAAYTHALIWAYTGDPASAKKAVQIMNAWSAVLVDHKFSSTYSDGHLQAAWVAKFSPVLPRNL